MIKKLFGETEEDQLSYLKPRLLALAAAVAAILLGGVLDLAGVGFGGSIAGLGEILFAIDIYIFGWAIMRGVFGVAAVGTLLSNNIILGSIILVVYLMLGAVGGMVVAVIGLCRFLVLLKKRKQ